MNNFINCFYRKRDDNKAFIDNKEHGRTVEDVKLSKNKIQFGYCLRISRSSRKTNFTQRSCTCEQTFREKKAIPDAIAKHVK